MTLWWIGNFVLILVIIPVVVVILNKVIEPANHIREYADDIMEHGAQFGPHLEALQDLSKTRDLVRRTRVDLERYARALEDIR